VEGGGDVGTPYRVTMKGGGRNLGGD